MLCSLINIKKIVFVVYNRNVFNFQKWFLHDIFNFKINKKINVNSIWRNRNNQMPIISIQNSLHLKRFHILSPILCSRLKNKLYFVTSYLIWKFVNTFFIETCLINSHTICTEQKIYTEAASTANCQWLHVWMATHNEPLYRKSFCCIQFAGKKWPAQKK